MYKYKLVVCDDTDEKEHSLRECLENKFIDIIRVNSLKELIIFLKGTPQVDGIFLDLFYPTGPEGARQTIDASDVIAVRSLVGASTKIIIYTRYTSDSIDLLKELAFSGVVNDWVDYEDLVKSESQPSALLRIHKCLNFKSELANGLWLLHLSDLHFGKQYDFAGDDVGKHLASLIDEQLKISLSADSTLGLESPHLCLVSGDLSNTAEPIEFENSRTFIGQLNKSLNSMPHREKVPFIVTPGNHDLSWRLSLVEEHNVGKNVDGHTNIIDVDDDKDIPYRMVKWLNFQRYFSDILDGANDKCNEGRWWFWDLSARFGVRIISYNTSDQITYRKHNAKILSNDIEKMSQAFGLSDNCLTIFISHHPVEKWSDSETTREDLVSLLHSRLGVGIIFSGHKHKAKILQHDIDNSESLVEIQTGSVAVDESENSSRELPNYRIVQITRELHGKWGKVKSWTFHHSGPKYMPKSLDAKGSYFEEKTFSVRLSPSTNQ